MAVNRIDALTSGVATTGGPRSGGPMRVALKSGEASRAASTRLASRGRVARTTEAASHVAMSVAMSVATIAARTPSRPKRSVLPGLIGRIGRSARSARRRRLKRLPRGL